MTETMILFVLIVSAVATFMLRFSFLWLDKKMAFPKAAAEWLKLIPSAAIMALIVPSLMASPSMVTAEGGPKLCAAIVSVIIMRLTRSAGLTLVVGMVALWLTHWLMG